LHAHRATVEGGALFIDVRMGECADAGGSAPLFVSRVAHDVNRAAERRVPLVSARYLLVDGRSRRALNQISVVLIDATLHRWALDGCNPVTIPTNEVADGLATLTLSAPGYEQTYVHVLFHAGQVRTPPRASAAVAAVGSTPRVARPAILYAPTPHAAQRADGITRHEIARMAGP
jgi:hypothetical protein